MNKSISYTPIKGWFDLSKLDLPKEKSKAYSELQAIIVRTLKRRGGGNDLKELRNYTT